MHVADRQIRKEKTVVKRRQKVKAAKYRKGEKDSTEKTLKSKSSN
jgi:hypothetical protein